MSHRLKICETCEINEDDFCLHCGCYIPAMVLDEKHECPLEKW